MPKCNYHIRELPTTAASAVSRTRHIQFVSGAIGITLLHLGYCSLIWKKFMAVVGVCPRLFCDFIDYYYPMGEAIFRTGIPVKGFLYSPFNAILLAVFPPMGFGLSFIIWGTLQVIAIILFIMLFYFLVPTRLSLKLLFVVLTLFSYPMLLNFLAGNAGMFITVSLLGLLFMSNRGRSVTAAALLALSVSFKFYPAIFLAPFIARRNTRLLLLSVVVCIVLLIFVPAVVLGGSGVLRFYTVLINSFIKSGWVALNPHSQFFPHFVLRLAGGTGAGASIPLLVLHAISYGIAAFNLTLLFLIQRARVAHAHLLGFQIMFLTVPFVLKTSWECDFIFLPFVQAFLVWYILENSVVINSSDGRIASKRKTMLLSLVLLSIFLTSIFFFNMLGNFTLYGYFGFPLIADILLLIVIYHLFLPIALVRSR